MNRSKVFSMTAKVSILTVCFFGISFVAGCAAPQKKALKICPGKANLDLALASLGSVYKNSTIPVKAVGFCKISSTMPGQDNFVQSFPVRIWHLPPGKLSVFGEMFFDQQAICFTVSGKNFWSYSKHMGVYYSGNTTGIQKLTGGNLFNIRPESMLQIVEPLGVAKDARLLENHGPFDILVSQNENSITKKIYIDCCQYLIRKIEYFDFTGVAFLTVLMENYKPVVGNEKYKFPHTVTMDFTNGENSLKMDVELNRVSIWQPSSKQVDLMFTQPSAEGFPNAFRVLDNGTVVRQ